MGKKCFSSDLWRKKSIHFVLSDCPQDEVLAQGPKVLVTGATGLLGRAVCREFQSHGWVVTGTGFRRARPRFLRCDLTDEDAVRRLLQEYKVKLFTGIYVFVFSRRRDNRTGSVARQGLKHVRLEAFYTKPSAVILRVPVLFGEVESVMESAVTSLWQKVQEATEESCPMDHFMQRFPTDARDVATVCRKLAERDPSIRGIFHFSGKEQMTKYEMAVAMAQAFNLPSNHLIPVTGSTPRPINSQLNCSRLELLNLSVEPRAFSTSIVECLWPFTADKRWRQTVFH
uniref:Methionine adenosyltransferase 2 subunit beta n=1 Tax=Cyprinodon variegatus TaxID=28743 RepID=A0A3Q2D0W7_CYPVA